MTRAQQQLLLHRPVGHPQAIAPICGKWRAIHRQTPIARSYRGSTPILGFDDLELLLDYGLHADGFLVQSLELAKALHPLRLACVGAASVAHQFVAQCLRDEFLKRLLSACHGRVERAVPNPAAAGAAPGREWTGSGCARGSARRHARPLRRIVIPLFTQPLHGNGRFEI